MIRFLYFFWLCIPSVCFSDDIIYKFPNGTQLVQKSDGVYFVNQGRERLVAEGTAYTHPNKNGAVGEEVRVKRGDAPQTSDPSPFVFIEVKGKGIVVNASGAIKEVPFESPDRIRIKPGHKGWDYVVQPFAEGGKHYLMISVWSMRERDHDLGEYFSERFIVREDLQGTSFARSSFEGKVGFELYEGTLRLMDRNATSISLEKMRPLRARGGESALNLEDETSAKVFRDLGDEIEKRGKILESPNPEDYNHVRRGLAKPNGGAVVVLGSSGVGKTNLVYSFAQKVRNGEFPEIPAHTQFIEVDAIGLTGGTRHRGVFEERLANLLEKSEGRDVIWVIDEIHSLKGSGTHSKDPNDIFQKIKTRLSGGRIKIIATDTPDEFYEAFEDDQALLRRFGTVNLGEPTGDDLFQRVRNHADRHSGHSISDDNLRFLINLSEDFDAVGAQPSKAIRLLDEVIADRNISGAKGETIGKKQIQDAAGRLYQIDPAEFDPKLREKKLGEYRDNIHSNLSGLEEIKGKLDRLALRSITGTLNPDKPRGGILFSGPKGIGKTTIPKEYARARGLPSHIVRMNRDAPGSGMTSHDLYREILTALRRNPFTVLIFDEIDKASIEVQNGLLDFMENKFIDVPSTSGHGKQSGRVVRVRTTGATVFFTSNAGQSYILGLGNEEFSDQSFRLHQVWEGMSEFLLDRIQENIPVFPPKSIEEFRAVLKLKLHEHLARHSEQLGVNFSVEEEDVFLDVLAKKYFRSGASYRQALDRLDSAIGTAISERALESNGALPKSCAIALSELSETKR